MDESRKKSSDGHRKLSNELPRRYSAGSLTSADGSRLTVDFMPHHLSTGSTGMRRDNSFSSISIISMDGKSKPRCPYCPMDQMIKEDYNVYHIFAEVLRAVGPFGRYQLYFCILIAYSTILWAGNYLFTSVNLLHPNWNCTKPGPYYAVESDKVGRDVFCRDVWDECKGYIKSYEGWFKSIKQEMLVDCSDELKLTYIHIAKGIAGVIGSLLGGHLSDKYGRSRFLLMCMFGTCLFSVLTITSLTLKDVVYWRFVQSLLQTMSETMVWALGAEITNSKHRLLANACHQPSIAYAILSLIAYLTKNWRLYLVMINFFSAPILIGWMILYESPRWIIQQQNYDRAANILLRMGSDQWNKKNVIVIGDELRGLYRHRPKGQRWLIHLFSTKPMLIAILMQSLAIITATFAYQTMMINLTRLSLHPFITTAIMGGVSIVVLISVIILDRKVSKFGRRTMFLISLVIIAICLIIMVICETTGEQWNAAILTVPVVIGLAVTTGIYRLSILQITVEYFPTILRGTAVGFVLAVEYAFMIAITAITLGTIGRPVSAGISLALVVITFIAGWFLQEETKGKFLKDTIQQVR